jgi:hypothetical protein
MPQGELPQREERRRKTSPRVDYTERRKTKKNLFVFFAQKRFFLVFLLTVEVLL